MVADCGATVAKYILCLFNFIFFVVGSAVLCIGVWLAVDKTSFIHLATFNTLDEGVKIQNQAAGIIRELAQPTVIEQGAYILIATGAFIFIISFLGYCGAIKESRVLLTAYGLFIIIIAVAQIGAIAFAAYKKEDAETHTKEFFLHTIRKYYTSKSQKDAVTLAWDVMMSQLHCCGVHNSQDFQLASEFIKYTREERQGQIVPEACCKLDPVYDPLLFKPADEDCLTSPSTSNSYMQTGCYDKVYETLINNLNIVIGVAVGVIAVQVLGIIFAFCLCKAVGNDRDYGHYKY